MNNANTNNNVICNTVTNLNLVPSPELFINGGPSIPVGDYFLVSDTGVYLISDTAVFLISNH